MKCCSYGCLPDPGMLECKALFGKTWFMDGSMLHCFQAHAEQRIYLLIPTIVSWPKRCKVDSSRFISTAENGFNNFKTIVLLFRGFSRSILGFGVNNLPILRTQIYKLKKSDLAFAVFTSEVFVFILAALMSAIFVVVGILYNFCEFSGKQK